MDEVARAAYEIMRMPVVVTDSSFVVRAKYPDEPMADEQWDANVIGRQIEPRFVKTFTDDDHFTHHDEAGKAILIDWGHYAAKPRLTAVIRSGDSIIGYFAALATDIEVQDWHYDAADAIGEAFALVMEASVGVSDSAQMGLASSVLYALLDGAADKRIDMRAFPPEVFEASKAPYALLCIRSINRHNAPLEAYIGREIAHVFGSSIHTIYEHALYVLVDNATGELKGSVREKQLIEMFEKEQLCCGVSHKFDSLEETRRHRWEAAQALEIARRLAILEPIVYYEDHLVEVACNILSQHMPQGSFSSVAFEELRRRDQRSGTAYFKTLKTYLE
ncbi:MAG: hypothetical protein J5804_03740, partial [Eggerthellaceae bacterium]|nr:hypothetical protein [Eggerthellaceae bacterium]